MTIEHHVAVLDADVGAATTLQQKTRLFVASGAFLPVGECKLLT
jgi:hypothetical protein